MSNFKSSIAGLAIISMNNVFSSGDDVSDKGKHQTRKDKRSFSTNRNPFVRSRCPLYPSLVFSLRVSRQVAHIHFPRHSQSSPLYRGLQYIKSIASIKKDCWGQSAFTSIRFLLKNADVSIAGPHPFQPTWMHMTKLKSRVPHRTKKTMKISQESSHTNQSV